MKEKIRHFSETEEKSKSGGCVRAEKLRKATEMGGGMGGVGPSHCTTPG